MEEGQNVQSYYTEENIYYAEESSKEDIDDLAITCEICQSLCEKPQCCQSCQKNFCEKCISQWQSQRPNNCPNRCHDPIFFENKVLKRMMERLKFKCPGCQKGWKRTEFEAHFKSCEGVKKKLQEKKEKEEKAQIKEALKDMKDFRDNLRTITQNIDSRIDHIDSALSSLRIKMNNLHISLASPSKLNTDNSPNHFSGFANFNNPNNYNFGFKNEYSYPQSNQNTLEKSPFAPRKEHRNTSSFQQNIQGQNDQMNFQGSNNNMPAPNPVQTLIYEANESQPSQPMQSNFQNNVLPISALGRNQGYQNQQNSSASLFVNAPNRQNPFAPPQNDFANQNQNLSLMNPRTTDNFFFGNGNPAYDNEEQNLNGF